MAIPAAFPDSDLQFLARMLKKTRTGDQVTRAEAHRLDEIAEHGHTQGNPPPGEMPTVFPPDATRSGQL